jgi:hypothetical protein
LNIKEFEKYFQIEMNRDARTILAHFESSDLSSIINQPSIFMQVISNFKDLIKHVLGRISENGSLSDAAFSNSEVGFV